MMKLGWLVMECLLCWYFLYFGSPAALALAVLLILVPLCTVPVNALVRRRLRIGVEAGTSLRKGDEGSVRSASKILRFSPFCGCAAMWWCRTSSTEKLKSSSS